jgi:hypothetical protein
MLRGRRREHAFPHVRLAILEFTRAIDSSEDWEEKKDAEKRSRYAPVLCQNSGFKARNYVDLYCESDWDYVNDDSRSRDTACVRAV